MDEERGGSRLESTRIGYKPLSVNKCWQGRRFKTAAYKQYEADLIGLLPSDIDIPEGPLSIDIQWGFSNKLSDWDNPIKPFQDILQTFYQFNDRDIWDAHVSKRLVKKGKEYIEFKIEEYNGETHDPTD